MMKSFMKFLFTLTLIISLAACGQSQSNHAGNQAAGQSEVTVRGSYQDADAATFRQMLKEKKGVVLDVRTPGEYAEGHLPGAMDIDFLSDDFSEKVAELPRDTTYLVYCRSGHRSHQAAKKMEGMGFKVVNLKGGIMGWQSQGYEIEK